MHKRSMKWSTHTVIVNPILQWFIDCSRFMFERKKSMRSGSRYRNPRVAFLRCSTVKSATSLGNNLPTTSLPQSLLSRSFAAVLAFFFSFSFTN